MGLFTDAYDLFCIPPIMQLIGRVYFENEPESREYQIQPAVLSTLLGIALLGTVIGQLVFDVPISQFVEENPPPLHPPSYPLLSKQFFRRHGRVLFSCSASWFLVDIFFYSSNLFQSQIYNQYVPKADKVNAYQDAFNIAKPQAIVAICSTIPGYWVTVCFIDRIGRVKIQQISFFSMAIVYLAIGIPYYIYWDDNTNIGFMILYGLKFFSSNFGPNTTTFIVPVELFPTRFRTTCHGISGAVGKVGAIIGSVGFLWASHDHKEEGYPKAIRMTASLVISGVVCILGLLVTTFFTRETMRRSLEENENDN
ncbi:probable inorganic phosphate transporter 1-9 [Quercus lobata]|uniref:probable inorganic phosphate transporter 1-9 n=1 Tax=Quercus lobata TaxID=97700 RepID=UPI001248465A|nr:probable inorganic phosphate transporter 1-9 [Quercus lobata]